VWNHSDKEVWCGVGSLSLVFFALSLINLLNSSKVAAWSLVFFDFSLMYTFFNKKMWKSSMGSHFIGGNVEFCKAAHMVLSSGINRVVLIV